MSEIQILIGMLKHDKPNKRYEACEELRVAPSLPPEALDALRSATNDENPDVADAAQRAISLHTIPKSSTKIAKTVTLPVSKKDKVIMGLFAGILGAMIGAVPIQVLKGSLADFVIGIYGSYRATPEGLFLLIYGFPLPFFMAIVCVPISGALFGIFGTYVSIHSKQAWLYGGMAGLLSNFLMGFMSQ